jgi:ATP-dependent DNA helicase RecQ
MMNRQEAEILLKKTFGLTHFYDHQWDTITRILNGERVLLIEKTGFGKSLCFQFPATIFPCMTVVFSPLIALMRDHVKKLQARGISAKCINSEQMGDENRQIIEEAKNGKIKILYIAPERQENNTWIEATQQMNLSMVVVDEAHCISMWGHDFRPAFKRMVDMINLLPKKFPVLATTATATKRTEEDIAQQIGGNDITIIRGNLMRDNLHLFVIKVESEDEKMIWLGRHIKDDEKLSGLGILYTGTQVNTEIYSAWFKFLDIASTAYHAGLDAVSRIKIEDGLMDNEWKCIISTNALGMGIDKPDIRFIVHTQIPQSPMHYYQEIGRSGRDGEVSRIILFYNLKEDKKLPEFFIKDSKPSKGQYEKVFDIIKRELCGQEELANRTNLTQKQIRVIISDLMEQNIVRRVDYGKWMYEFIPDSPLLNTKSFEELRERKKREFEKMLEYLDIKTSKKRMRFLCKYLGDESYHTANDCDDKKEKPIKVIVSPEWKEKLQDFRESFFPELLVESNGSNMVNGVAASYYGFSDVGESIKKSKYRNGGDFSDFLLQKTLKAFKKNFVPTEFNLILYVPSTNSGDLVKNFSERVSNDLGIPVSHKLQKKRPTKAQKIFENKYLKEMNVRDAFSYKDIDEISDKNILLIDDVFDSGATIKEVGRLLTGLGVKKIVPLVIAKTVGGVSV